MSIIMPKAYCNVDVKKEYHFGSFYPLPPSPPFLLVKFEFFGWQVVCGKFPFAVGGLSASR
jgi:hypothetical protein